MAVCRVEKNKNYTTMSNYHLRDPNLSNKARGLLSTMLSLPDNWDYTTRGLAKICKDGVDGITAQLKELEQYGYLVRHRIRDSTGRITDMEYIIYERPHTASPDTEKPYMVKPDMALPRLETPAQINIDKRITEEINAFLAFKAWSDENFHEEENLDHRESNHTLSMDDLSEAALAVPAVDVAVACRQERMEKRRKEKEQEEYVLRSRLLCRLRQ